MHVYQRSAVIVSSALLLANAGCAHKPANSEVASVTSADRSPASYTIQNYPILEALEASGQTLSETTKKWMKKWRGMDLDDSSQYRFDELSGSTSINLKIKKVDTAEADGTSSRGSFVPRNGAANPNTEIAYFNMAAILGYDGIFRPAARYELGSGASAKFKALIGKTTIKGTQRLENKARILKEISSGNPLKGCVKAKKFDTETALDAIANTGASPNGAPKSSHAVIGFLQASHDQPRAGHELTLKSGYVGDELQLAHEYSVIMTLDAIFQQWDRYSGGNVVISKDEAGHAHFYATDNGGADVSSGTSWVERNLGWFSRYDKNVIERLGQVLAFLENPSSGFLGYTDANKFVVDLGLYTELKPEVYVERLKRNLTLLMKRVESVKAHHGSDAFLD